MLIEDEQDISDLICFNLEKNNFAVLRAYDGLDGLKQAKKHSPDLIVMDLMLPELNGIGVLKRLQGDNATKEIPVVMLTARNQPEDRIAGLEMGAEDYLSKPFSPKELVLRINKIVGRKKKTIDADLEIKCGPFFLSKESLTFHVDGNEVGLTDTHLTSSSSCLFYVRTPISPKREMFYSIT